MNRRQHDSAWQYALKPALVLLNQLPPSDSAHRIIHQLLGLYYANSHQPAGAVREWNTVAVLSQATGDSARLIQSQYNLSVVYADLGLYQQSIDYSLKNLRL